MNATADPNLRISLLLRIWLAVEVVFGVLSLVTIAWTPENTAQHFAWPIASQVTAAMLGGFYVAAASFYVLSLFALRWENIRVFVPASIVFASIEFLATIIHLDKFSVGTTPFNVWFVSYLLPPPLFIYFYWWHQKRAVPIPRPDDEPFAPAMRTIMFALGGIVALYGLLVFVVPSVLISIAPNPFTPLTARAASGWITALGMLLVLAARENDRTRARIISPFFILLLPAIIIEMSRFREQIDWSRWSIWLGIAILVVAFAIGLVMARGDSRRTMR